MIPEISVGQWHGFVHVLRIVVIIGASLVLYPLTLRRLIPDAYDDLTHRLGRLHPAVRRWLVRQPVAEDETDAS